MIKPSDVEILAMSPLTGTFRKTEAECAAALLIWYMQQNGDEWQSVTPKQLGAAMTENHFSSEPFKSWNRNPFFRPDIRRLIIDGFLTEGEHPPDMGGPLTFTEKALEALQNSHWIKTPKV